ncbi:MAG: hypothetical protein E7077_05835 [Bacteroidales bacterium]|jgi:uncharacterized membrane protein|nr:hypothetical protein [Bacteroidales bacterium]
MISDFNSELIQKVFENVKETIECSELMAYCQILAGIFTLAYFGNIIWKTWGKGAEIHIVDLCKPFVVLVCITNFSLVTGLFDSLIYQPLNNATLTLVENNNNVLTELQKYIIQKNNIEQKESEEEGNLVSKTIDTVKQSVSAVWKLPSIIAMCTFNLLAQLLCVIAKTCMIAYSFLLRIILSVFGPIAFALSLIPYFSDNIKNWISKYIGALLYVPICNIILYVTQCYATAMFQLQNSELNLVKNMYNVLSSDLVVSVMFIVSACAYFTVPKLAGMIVSMADYGSEVGIGGAVKSVATVGGTLAAGVATGGASLAATGDGGFLQAMGNLINQAKGGFSNPTGTNQENKDNSGVRGDS